MTRLLVLALAWMTFGFQEAPSLEEDIRARLEALETAEDDVSREQRELYRQAQAQLEAEADAQRRTAEFEEEIAAAPQAIESLRRELSAELPDAGVPSFDLFTLRELEDRHSGAEAELSAAAVKLDALEARLQHRATRRVQLPEEIAQAQALASQLRGELDTLSAGPSAGAGRALLRARLRATAARVDLLQAEQHLYEAERDLLPLQRDAAQRAVNQQEGIVTQLHDALAARRRAEAEAAAEAARQRRHETAIENMPALSAIAKRNEELALMRSGEEGLASRVTVERDQRRDVRAERDEIAAKREAARRRARAGGLSEAIGVVLRRDYENLPSRADLARQASEISKRLSDAELARIDVEEARGNLVDLDARIEETMEALGEEATPELRALVTELLQQQQELSDEVHADLTFLTTELTSQEEAHADLRRTVEEYRSFIEERILWIRSTDRNPLPSFAAAPAHLSEVTASFLPGTFESATAAPLRERGAAAAALTIFALLLVASRRFLRHRREALADGVRSYRSDRFALTVRAFVVGVGIASPGPILLWTVGWFLSPSSHGLFESFGQACRDWSADYWILAMCRQVAAPRGLGDTHFRWGGDGMRKLRVELRWFLPLYLVTGILAFTFQEQARPEWADSLGRLAFVTGLVALAQMLRRLIASNLLDPLERSGKGKGLLMRTQRLWSSVAVLLPLVLVGLALSGYTYTAFQFEVRLRSSISLALGLALLHALLLRWLFLTRRRLAIEQARQRAKAKAATDPGASEQATDSGSAPAFDEDSVNIPAVDAQTRELFRSGITLSVVLGLYFIWAGALPALRGFESVQLWPEVRILETLTEDTSDPALLSTVQAADPATAQATAPASSRFTPLPVASPAGGDEPASEFTLTLADLSLGVIFLLLTWIISRNVPGLLEITVLQRLPLDGGGRYAVSTIVRYLILIAGSSAAFGALGLAWDQIQWLAAAMTFGLAFGLQEIFANFVSGLIILLERPVRVGDIVTVGETEGRITKLRMRATTVLDRDRRELLIPNKEFITGSVINWTLSDPVTRLIVPVGIAYGSDTATARKLLLKVAKETNLVIDDPSPSAIFMGFGASSLDFELRVFFLNRDLWPELTDRLHTAIDAEFRKADIEIAFPQRDLHLRSAEGLRGVRLEPPDAD